MGDAIGMQREQKYRTVMCESKHIIVKNNHLSPTVLESHDLRLNCSLNVSYEVKFVRESGERERDWGCAK